MFRPNSDTLRGIFGLPGQNQNKSLHKTDCCNVLSDCCQKVCSAIQQQFPAATGAKVRLWTRSGILKKKVLQKNYYTASAAAAGPPRVCYLNVFYRATCFFQLVGHGGGSPIGNLTPIFFVKKKFLNITVTCDQQEKVLSGQKVLL